MENKTGIDRFGGSVMIGSREYPITAVCCTADGQRVPVVSIPLMSDEKWHTLTKRQAGKAGSV